MPAVRARAAIGTASHRQEGAEARPRRRCEAVRVRCRIPPDEERWNAHERELDDAGPGWNELRGRDDEADEQGQEPDPGKHRLWRPQRDLAFTGGEASDHRPRRREPQGNDRRRPVRASDQTEEGIDEDEGQREPEARSQHVEPQRRVPALLRGSVGPVPTGARREVLVQPHAEPPSREQVANRTFPIPTARGASVALTRARPPSLTRIRPRRPRRAARRSRGRRAGRGRRAS